MDWRIERNGERSPTKRKQRNPVKSMSLDLLACETLILDFLSIQWSEEEPAKITEQNLFEFRKFVQDKKDALDEYMEK